MPQIVDISGNELIGEAAFHDSFQRILGFFAGYGRNMNAWIDCMGYLREPSAKMTKLHVGASETLTIMVRDYEALRDGAPKQWADLIECTAIVNLREVENGEVPILALAFC